MNIQIAAQHFYEYSKYMKGFSSSTIKRYKQAINYYSKFARIDNLEQITSMSIYQMFFHGRMEQNWKPASFISYQKSLSVFFVWCIKQGYLDSNPTEGLESPKLEKHLPKNLSKQDALKLLEGVYNYPYDNTFIRLRNHAIFSTLIFAGLRKSEILNLGNSDVDLNNLTLFIREGKGKKDRIIPICGTLAISLNRYQEARKRLKIDCAAFFASSTKNRGISDTTLKRMVELFQKSTNIKYTLHRLRHTFATLMIEGGCDIYSLSRMMGHEDIRTTTWYLHATTQHLKSQMIKHPLNN